MSNIDSNIIDPGKSPPPDVIVPEIDPDKDELVEPDDIREPDSDAPAIEPDPEETNTRHPTIRNA